MPSVKSSWSTSSTSSLGLRLGAGLVVLGLHVAVVAAIFSSVDEEKPKLPDNDAIMVSAVEAPEPQLAKADPTPEPPQPPQPPEPPPPPPEPEVKPDPIPDPVPQEKTEPEPEPEPVVERPPEPAKPKPKPKPQPKPQPKPLPKEQTPPKPVETPPPAAPSGTPEGDSKPQAPRQGPPKDQPDLVSNIEYAGRGPAAVYPLASQRLRETGRVMVQVVINTEGTIERATIISSSGYSRLDEAALDALRRVRFKPYTRNGVAYTVQARIPFDFNLRN